MTSNDAGGPGVPDEEWARFVREAEQGAGQAPAEPSARARMVTERLRREDEQRAGAARGRFGRRSGPARHEPPGWRTGPAWQDMRGGRGAGRRRLKATLAVVFIAGLGLVAVRPELVIDRITGKAEARSVARTAAPLPAESVRPTTAPEAVDPDRPTLKEPFRGSPAVQWADGVAGIELPAAEAVGGMSKERVAEGLENVKRFLVVSNLDPATLRGERPSEALKLLDPKMKELNAGLEKSLSTPSRENDPLSLFTRADPAELKPVGDVVKVRGRMWVEPGRKGPGEAEIRVDFSFVYPFVKAKAGSTQVERTIVRRVATFSIADPRKFEATTGKLWLVEYNRDIANSACDVDDGYLHPTFDMDPVTGPTPSGAPVDPYDRSKGLDGSEQEECGVVSRS
ncbi:hypothetical protein MTF65_19005 [Streptomyces sp. APSN-46.1]|uniref:hypothetical protein n=1 Tax=Streptomyces sp. APSN-46.1 TaxID=2929049 RepID=UPI001FB27B15|nr:hypothetical protein [Streptomyces sp. APSN-46.1]MCJ1679390.1 hypothetical protein [Streptomyces sp. APSN-46.1]